MIRVYTYIHSYTQAGTHKTDHILIHMYVVTILKLSYCDITETIPYLQVIYSNIVYTFCKLLLFMSRKCKGYLTGLLGV